MNSMYGGVYIPNLANDAKQYGIGEYRFAHNYEFAGKTFKICADGKEYTLHFCCEHGLEFNGEKTEWECEKLEKTMYFVRFGANCAAIDLENGLATLVLDGEEKPVLGVIDGYEPKEKQAICTDDMVGTFVRWVFGVNRYVNHDYCAPGKIRSAWARHTVHIGGGRSFRDGWQPTDADYVEEDAVEVKLGGAYYLVIVDAKMPEGEGYVAPADVKKLVLLEDYDRCMTVGCAFGSEGGPIMMAGYAMFLN